MFDTPRPDETESRELIAFGIWLRTGLRVVFEDPPRSDERKFNPYHDPRDGRFTFAPGGGSLAPRTSHRSRTARSPIKVQQHRQAATTPGRSQDQGAANKPEFIHAQFQRNPRVRIGGNGGPPLNDPATLEHVFPRAAGTPGGAIVAMADNILDLTGPAARLTADVANAHSNMIINQIREIDPSYRFDSLGYPQTIEGQVNQIRQLRIDRATAFYRARNDLRPLQVETLRFLQQQTDKAYDIGVRLYNEGELKPRLSREEAIGNFIDREVRNRLREFYNLHELASSRDGPLRIIGREYADTGTDRTYRVPDARVGNIAFDVSLTRKMHSTAQIRGYFSADFRPDAVVIIRPNQLGQDATYSLHRPR